jgi:hypothetical protein
MLMMMACEWKMRDDGRVKRVVVEILVYVVELESKRRIIRRITGECATMSLSLHTQPYIRYYICPRILPLASWLNFRAFVRTALTAQPQVALMVPPSLTV